MSCVHGTPSSSRHEQKPKNPEAVQRLKAPTSTVQHSRGREEVPTPPESQSVSNFGFGSSPEMFSSGNDLFRENAEQMRKISDTFYTKMSGFGVGDPFANAVDNSERVNHWYFDNVTKRKRATPKPQSPPPQPEQKARPVVEHTTLRAFTEPQVQ